MEKYASSELGGVLHCFNASAHLLPLANMNFYFGIGGVITFKNAKKLVEILPLIPQDKLIIETDAPYLTPQVYRGQRNEPKYVKHVAEEIAKIRNVSIDEVAEKTTENFKVLFSLK